MRSRGSPTTGVVSSEVVPRVRGSSRKAGGAGGLQASEDGEAETVKVLGRTLIGSEEPACRWVGRLKARGVEVSGL